MVQADKLTAGSTRWPHPGAGQAVGGVSPVTTIAANRPAVGWQTVGANRWLS